MTEKYKKTLKRYHKFKKTISEEIKVFTDPMKNVNWKFSGKDIFSFIIF